MLHLDLGAARGKKRSAAQSRQARPLLHRSMYQAPGKPSILIADHEQSDARISAILRGYERRFVRTLARAKDLLQTRAYNLVVIGERFDGGRVNELLEWLRANERISSVPVACIAPPSAAKLADVFIDYRKFPAGDAGDRRIRSMLDQLLESRSGPFGVSEVATGRRTPI